MRQSKILTLWTLLLCPLCLFAWGQKGHDTVAHIAERHLTPRTAHAVDSLLRGKSMVYWSNWLDNASHTAEYEYSKTWHYKNIDEGENFDKVKTPATGDIVSALDSQLLILADTAASKDDRALALKMVTHLFGDLHQPMHLGHFSDRGGNRVTVKFFNRGTNLHSVWDTNLPEAGHKWSYTEWRENLDRLSPADEAAVLAPATPREYARETYEICSRVYEATPEMTNITYDYIADWTPVVERQLLKGGLRLADALNKALDPGYEPPTVAGSEGCGVKCAEGGER